MVDVKKEGYVEPFSRWKLKESITSAGVSRQLAYKISLDIHNELMRKNVKSATDDMIRIMVESHLGRIDPKARERYVLWSRFRHEKVPLIILIGGASGIGKSSVALEVAHRLGIRKVIGTDTIREIMRYMVAPDLMPAIHHSSYSAWEALPYSFPEKNIVAGFCEQARAVCTGIEAVVSRSIKEGISLVVEGVHIVPEMIDDNPNVMTFIISLEDMESHKDRFRSRASETHMRRDARHYIDSIDGIIDIQSFLVESAKKVDVPIIENTEFNDTVKKIITITTENVKRLMR